MYIFFRKQQNTRTHTPKYIIVTNTCDESKVTTSLWREKCI